MEKGFAALQGAMSDLKAQLAAGQVAGLSATVDAEREQDGGVGGAAEAAETLPSAIALLQARAMLAAVPGRTQCNAFCLSFKTPYI